jgi:hypothetical protein
MKWRGKFQKSHKTFLGVEIGWKAKKIVFLNGVVLEV